MYPRAGADAPSGSPPPSLVPITILLDAAMLNAAIRNAALFGSILLGALLVGGTAGGFASLRGVAGPTIGFAESPVRGIVLLVLALVPTAVMAIVVGRIFNAVVGCFVVGAALAALSMRFGTIEDFAFAAGSPIGAAIETTIWAVVVAVLAFVVFVGSGPLPDLHRRRSSWVAELADSTAAIFLAAAAVAVPVVWFVVQTPAKGQALGGTILAGAAVGFVGRLLAPRTQPILLFATPVLAGAAAMLIGAFGAGPGIADAFVDGSLSRLAYPMPIDWAAGGLCGVAIGLGWARGFVKEDPAPTPSLKRAIHG